MSEYEGGINLLEQLKDKFDKLVAAEVEIDKSHLSDFTKSVSKISIVERKREVKKQIEEIEYREQTRLRTKIIDDMEVEIPQGFNYGDKYKYFYIDGIIYAISQKGVDSDGSFHYWGYAWIQDKDKCVNLLVRALGNDVYGDRIYTEIYYYKDKRDSNCYLNKPINPNNRKYKLYINKIIELLREQNGIPNFMVERK